MCFRLLPGLPSYGDTATPYPATWGRAGREGIVVEFAPSTGTTWVANFEPGLGGVSGAVAHPDGHQVLVFARGDVWAVDPTARKASQLGILADEYWPVGEPPGLVIDRQGLAFLRLGPGGIAWHTRRLSWDGFSEITLTDTTLAGNAWSAIDDRWMPFAVDLSTGASLGGAFDVPGSLTGDWEQLAPNDGAT